MQPGGASAVPTSPWYLDLLPRWLTNDTAPLLDRRAEVVRAASSVELFVP